MSKINESNNKLVIGLDADDTMLTTTDGIMSRLSEHVGEQVDRGDITDYSFWNAYGFTNEEAIDFVHSYEHEGYPGIKLMPGLLDVLEAHKDIFEYHVITARVPALNAITHEVFADTGVSHLLAEVHHTANKFLGGETQTKSDVARKIGACAVIDNSVHEVLECERNGVRAYLIGIDSWQVLPPESSVVSVADWHAARDVMRDLIGQSLLTLEGEVR